MENRVEIGLIGLDTSHVDAFTRMFHEEDHPFYIPDGKITYAYPGGSKDFELSAGRVGRYTELLKGFGVEMVDSPKEVAERCDAVMITSVDGRVHLDQFQDIAACRKPVFIDKPFTVDSKSAQKIFEIAKDNGTPLMSCSTLRYDESLTRALADDTAGKIIGVDCYGPMELQPTQPGLFWYGIHCVEMLYTILENGCEEVYAYHNENHEFVVGVWEDGRIGTVRGNREGNRSFGSAIHREKGSQSTNSSESKKPFDVCTIERVIQFMKTGRSEIQPETTLEIIRFIEAANESRQTGKSVKL